MRHIVHHVVGLGAAFAAASGPAFADGDAIRGEKVFVKCKSCHSLQAGTNKIGPSLAGLFGDKAGSVEGFKYSDAMKSSGIVWDERTLDEYLAKPAEKVPGTKMTFAGLNREEDRQNLIAYLKKATAAQ